MHALVNRLCERAHAYVAVLLRFLPFVYLRARRAGRKMQLAMGVRVVSAGQTLRLDDALCAIGS